MNVLVWMMVGFDKPSTSEHLLREIVRQLCQQGHRVTLLQKDEGGDRPAIPADLAVYPDLSTINVPFRPAGKGNLAARYLASLRYVRNSAKKIRDEYDAIFLPSTTVSGFMVRQAMRRAPRAIRTVNVQDLFPRNAVVSGSLRAGGPLHGILSATQRYAWRNCRRIITISEDMKETLAQEGAPPERVEVVYNWSYQDEPYGEIDLSPVRGLFPPGLFHVVYAGNIGVMQNVELLLEAATLMRGDPGVRFHIIGNGVRRDRLAARARDEGLDNVDFSPMQPAALAPAIYRAADVNVIPLIAEGYRTALPSKTATCLACGKPVIFAIGEQSRFGQTVARETGCPLVSARDPRALAAAIQDVRSGRVHCHTGDFFARTMGKTAGARRYAQIITGQ